MTSRSARGANDAGIPVILSQIHEEGCDVCTFRLSLPEGTRFDFRPGQFVLAAFPDIPAERRPFSISSSPLEADFIDITLGRNGGLSERMLALKGGETLLISPPQGSWHFRDTDRNAVLLTVDGCLGPLRSIIRYVLDKGLPNKLALFYAAPKPSCILYRQELEDFARQGIVVHTTLTDAAALAQEELWDGPTGPITLKDIRDKVKDYKTAAYYPCGPNRFVDEIQAELLKAGVGEDAILASKWGDF